MTFPWFQFFKWSFFSNGRLERWIADFYRSWQPWYNNPIWIKITILNKGRKCNRTVSCNDMEQDKNSSRTFYLKRNFPTRPCITIKEKNHYDLAKLRRKISQERGHYCRKMTGKWCKLVMKQNTLIQNCALNSNITFEWDCASFPKYV